MESAAIFEWLATEVSPDTFVKLMDQYRPAYQVGEVSRDGVVKYQDIARCPTGEELSRAREAALAPGLWRFDDR